MDQHFEDDGFAEDMEDGSILDSKLAWMKFAKSLYCGFDVWYSAALYTGYLLLLLLGC